MSLREYIIKVREAIDRFDAYGFSESTDIREEIRAGKQAIIKIEVVLVDGSFLRIREYIEAKYQINKISYAYQYQDRDKKLIFRYDNAVHRPGLGFKEHKHVSSGEIINAESPDISDLVDEVIGYI
jgi:hypothetical protein